MSFVADASVALAWVFEDERHAGAWHLVERLQREPALVPTHFHLEVSNGLLVALRRGRLSLDQAATAIVLLEALPVEVDYDTPARAFHDVWLAASRHGLSTYDAAYLELAARRGLPLATLDERLAGAARGVGVQTLL